MKVAMFGTPIFWVCEKKALINIEFEIHSIRADLGDELLNFILNSSLIENKSAALMIADNVIKGISYKLTLINHELEYFDNYVERIEQITEDLLEQFMFNKGGYHRIQA
jgi:hypothetical protein